MAAAFFVAQAPTLSWLEFSSSMENLVVATSLEIHRTHKWLLPTLEDEPRTAKPPLAAWIAAGTIRPSTLKQIDDPDAARRDAAYRKLAVDVRWPALLASCVMLLAVFDLGKTLAGKEVGLLSMLVCGSTLYLLRFGRQATTDVQLALWVTIANAALARLVVRGPAWGAAAVAGAALGMAMMSKGPVGLLQSIVPACAYAVWTRRARISIPQVAVGVVLMLAIGGAWYAYVAYRIPEVWARWQVELARSSPGEKAGNFLSYATIFAYMLPWTPVFIHGLIWTGVETAKHRSRPGVFALPLLLVVVPIVIMSFFPDRQARYLLPLVGSASVIAARSITAMLNPNDRGRLPPWAQWATIAVLAVGLPVAGATMLKRIDGQPWYPLAPAVCMAVALAMGIVILTQVSRRWPVAMIAGTALVMLVLQPMFFFGYRDTAEGLSDMRPLAELIRANLPDAEMFYYRPDAKKRADVSLSIYLNRSTRWVASPAEIPASARAQVMLVQQRKGEPMLDIPPGWINFEQTARGKDVFWSFVRLPQTKRESP